MTIDEFASLFGFRKPAIGVVHLLPLPGSPGYGGSMADVVERARSDAAAYRDAGFHGLIVENYGDVPFWPDRVGPETVAAMSAVVWEVARSVRLPVGVNVLRNDARAALAIAAAVGARFVRVNVHTGAMVTDQGIIEGRAAETARFRKQLGAGTFIFADVLVKHGQPLGQIGVEAAVADTVERGLADAVIVTGQATGEPCDLEELARAKRAAGEVPVLAGSGVNADNVGEILAMADGVVVGTSVKLDARTSQPVDRARATEFITALRGCVEAASGR